MPLLLSEIYIVSISDNVIKKLRKKWKLLSNTKMQPIKDLHFTSSLASINTSVRLPLCYLSDVFNIESDIKGEFDVMLR